MSWQRRQVVLGIGVVAACAVSAGLRSWAGEGRSLSGAPTEVRSQPPTGPQSLTAAVPAFAPPASGTETEVIDAARLLGIPLVRTQHFPTASPSAFFCAAALGDPDFPRHLRSFVAGGGRALLTSRLAGHLGRLPSQFADRIWILPSQGGTRTVLSLPQSQVDPLRNFVIYPLGLRMEAPPRVALTLLGHGALVLDNHNSFAAGVKLTFLTAKWPAVRALIGDGGEMPLSGSTIALQALPRAAQTFQIVSR
jgi:hypothetical protein